MASSNQATTRQYWNSSSKVSVSPFAKSPFCTCQQHSNNHLYQFICYICSLVLVGLFPNVFLSRRALGCGFWKLLNSRRSHHSWSSFPYQYMSHVLRLPSCWSIGRKKLVTSAQLRLSWDLGDGSTQPECQFQTARDNQQDKVLPTWVNGPVNTFAKLWTLIDNSRHQWRHRPWILALYGELIARNVLFISIT